MALRLGQTNEDFAGEAALIVFPQACPTSYDPGNIRSLHSQSASMDPGMEEPFTMAELQGALFSITKLHGAPKPDMITV